MEVAEIGCFCFVIFNVITLIEWRWVASNKVHLFKLPVVLQCGRARCQSES